MATMATARVTTAQQVLELDEPGCRHELVGGDLRRMTVAGSWHSIVAAQVVRLLGNHAAARGAGHVTGADGGFLLERDPDTVRVPDAAFTSMVRVPAAPSRGYIEGPPDFAVEVVSPSDRYGEVRDKALMWLASGTRLVWVVEPIARSVTVYRPGAETTLANGEDELTGDDVLPGFAVRVRDLFPA